MSKEKEERIAALRTELEELTGMIISFRNREKYNKYQAALQKKKRNRVKELEAVIAKRHDPFCACDECYRKAQTVQKKHQKLARGRLMA